MNISLKDTRDRDNEKSLIQRNNISFEIREHDTKLLKIVKKKI